jgi:hypothetical protein
MRPDYVPDAEQELRCFFPFRWMPSRYFVLYVGCYPTIFAKNPTNICIYQLFYTKVLIEQKSMDKD